MHYGIATSRHYAVSNALRRARSLRVARIIEATSQEYLLVCDLQYVLLFNGQENKHKAFSINHISALFK